MLKKLKQKFSQLEVTANQLVLFITLYFVAVFNEPFLERTINAILELEQHSTIFMFTVPFLLLSLLLIIFSLFSAKPILKPLFVALTLISSLLYFATSTYGVVFDYSMMVNVIETDNSEALAYLNIQFILVFLVTGILPALAIAFIKVRYHSFGKEILQRLKLIFSGVGLFLIIAYFFYSNYASVGRNNRDLKKYIIPTQAIDSSYKVVRDHYFTEPLVFKTLDSSPTITATNNGKKNVVVLVIGETARSANFSYYGYNRATNAHSEKHQPIAFQNMTSCGTATAVSVPCLFSTLDRSNYDKPTAKSQQNLLDIAQLAGVNISWIDNNSGCKGVCARVDTIDISTDKSNPLCDGDYCFDEALMAPLKKKLTEKLAQPQQSALIVLHMIGSHGPTYYRRYPKETAPFLPDCPKSDIQNCSSQELINTYDNTIAYTDYILAKIIEELKILPNDVNTSMLYVSDHGESLGESGAYLHGFPYAFAPKEQYEIPMIFWAAESNNAIDKECLTKEAQQGEFSHDNVFSSMLGLLNIKSSTYVNSKDVFASCKQ